MLLCMCFVAWQFIWLCFFSQCWSDHSSRPLRVPKHCSPMCLWKILWFSCSMHRHCKISVLLLFVCLFSSQPTVLFFFSFSSTGFNGVNILPWQICSNYSCVRRSWRSSVWLHSLLFPILSCITSLSFCFSIELTWHTWEVSLHPFSLK